MTDWEVLLARTYDALNRRQVDEAMPYMHADVEWPNEMEGGVVRGHAAVREYWIRYLKTCDPNYSRGTPDVSPEGVVTIEVRRHIRDFNQKMLALDTVTHVFTMAPDSIRRLVIQPVAARTWVAPLHDPERQYSPEGYMVLPGRDADIPEAFAERFVNPFYRSIVDEKFLDALRRIYDEIDEARVSELLSYANWRTRCPAAYFVAAKGFLRFEHEIGRILIVDSCETGAGHAYCLALARLNTPTGLGFLREHLDRLLTHRDSYDCSQMEAMTAVVYLDRVNGTSIAAEYLEKWEYFAERDGEPNLELYDREFERQLNLLSTVGSRA